MKKHAKRRLFRISRLGDLRLYRLYKKVWANKWAYEDSNRHVRLTHDNPVEQEMYLALCDLCEELGVDKDQLLREYVTTKTALRTLCLDHQHSKDSKESILTKYPNLYGYI